MHLSEHNFNEWKQNKSDLEKRGNYYNILTVFEVLVAFNNLVSSVKKVSRVQSHYGV